MLTYEIRPDVSDQSLNELFATAWDGYVSASFERIRTHSLTYACAFDGPLLVGFVNVAWDGGIHAFILDTTVHGGYQRRGIGKALVAAVADIARTRGVKWLHVDFEPHAEEFYRRCGFVHTEAGLRNLLEDAV